MEPGMLIYVVLLLLMGKASCNASCSKTLPIKNAAAARRSNHLYSGINSTEIQQVIDFLLADKRLDLVNASSASIRSNYIFVIDDFLPAKKTATDWLDGKTSVTPTRMAKATLFLGKSKRVMELLVYPIPSPRFKTELYLNTSNKATNDWLSRPVSQLETQSINKALKEGFKPINNLDIIRDSFAPNCSSADVFSKCLGYIYAPRISLETGERHLFMFFFIDDRMVEGYYLHTVPLTIIMKENDGDLKVVKIYYNGKNFTSIESLYQAYISDTTLQYRLPDIKKQQGSYGSPKYVRGNENIDQVRRQPMQFSPEGPRFGVQGRYVEWLGWSFCIHTSTVTGMRLYDLRFRGQRIAYEISLQNLAVIYSGRVPDDYFRNYFDDGWGVGLVTYPLIRDFDCPPGAVYLNGSAYRTEKDAQATLKDAICIFEHRNSVPLRRHFSASMTEGDYRFAFSMPDTVLTVRQIFSVWNYDYILDYEIHQNGLVEAKLSPSGYVQVDSHPLNGESGIGYELNTHWKTIGMYHHHVLSWKIDLDIYGSRNSIKKINFKSKPINSEYAGSMPWYKIFMEETIVESEGKAKMKVSYDDPSQIVVYNSLYNNRDGAPRGYKIEVRGAAKIALPDSSPLMKGGFNIGKYPLSFTKRKDDEPGTSSFFTQGNPFNQPINFEKFSADDESLVNEDIVAWATIGMHHIPVTEDLPVTSSAGKTLSVSLTPFNYFTQDPSMSSQDAALFWDKAVFNLPDEYLHYQGFCPVSMNRPRYTV